jgi:hypothetical protein
VIAKVTSSPAPTTTSAILVKPEPQDGGAPPSSSSGQPGPAYLSPEELMPPPPPPSRSALIKPPVVVGILKKCSGREKSTNQSKKIPQKNIRKSGSCIFQLLTWRIFPRPLQKFIKLVFFDIFS